MKNVSGLLLNTKDYKKLKPTTKESEKIINIQNEKSKMSFDISPYRHKRDRKSTKNNKCES